MTTRDRRAAERQIVRRLAFPSDLEIRRHDGAGEGAAGSIAALRGYAAVFNSTSHPLFDWWEDEEFVEVIAPGAFRKTLQEADVRMFYQHDPTRVLARTKSGTLRLAEDDKGLAFEVDLPDTGDGRDLLTLVERGDISSMSFGFRVILDDWDRDAAPTVRTLREIALVEVSPVTFPAYEATEIGLRADAMRGLVRFLGLRGLEREQRDAALVALTGGTLTSDHLPFLRAAHAALGEAVASVEPPAHPALGRSPSTLRRRHARLLDGGIK